MQRTSSPILAMMQSYMEPRGRPTSKDWQPAKCPFHNDTHASFGINLRTGSANCFVCGSFPLRDVMVACGVPQTMQQQVFRFLPSRSRREDDSPHMEYLRLLMEVERKAQGQNKLSIPETVLGTMLPAHAETDLGEQFTQETVDYFQVVYDPSTERVVWPIRAIDGSLAALSGRRTGSDGPKYKVYESELQDFVPGYVAYNKDHLYHMHNVAPRIAYGQEDSIVIVEGYKACAWLVQLGFLNTCALMGAQITREQSAIARLFQLKNVVLFLDNNKAGWQGTVRTAEALLKSFNVFVCCYPDDREQPDDLTEEEVITSITGPMPYIEWRLLMSGRRSLSAGMAHHRQPKKSSGGGGLYLSSRFEPPKNDNDVVRVRLVPGSFAQRHYNHFTGEMELVEGQQYWKRVVHWPAFNVDINQVEFNNARWKGPIECTAGDDPNDPQPCLGCYYNNLTYHNGTKQTPQATAVVEIQLTVIVLRHFHKVQTTNATTGQTYNEWVPCKKNPRNGRGNCNHCDAQTERVWGRKMHWSMKERQWEELARFNDMELSQIGTCGCSIFAESFTCENCEHPLLDLATCGMDDAEAVQWSMRPHTCPNCGVTAPPIENFGCDRTSRTTGEQITNCGGVGYCDIWNTDLNISTKLSSNGRYRELVFGMAGNSGILPFAPRSESDWAERWEAIATPYDFPSLGKTMDISEQVAHTGAPFNPFLEDAHTYDSEAPDVGGDDDHEPEY